MTESPPSVLHVSQPIDGGVGSYVAELAVEQHQRGWRVAVACPEHGALPDRLRQAGVPLLPWEASRSPGPTVPQETRALSRILSAARPDVVLLHSSKAGLCGRLALRGRRPTLFFPHGWSWLAADGPVAVASRLWERGAGRWATRTVCVSDGEAALGSAAGVVRLAVVRNGVDVERWQAVRARRAEARAALQLRPGQFLAVSVGRPSVQKGHDRLLSAWPTVRLAAPDAQLVVVGEGPDRPALAARAVPGVDLPGEREVEPYLAAADVFVLPSRWEGLSLALLEAMAAGVSVVTTAVAGSEVVGSERGTVLGGDPRDDAAVIRGLEVELGRQAAGPRSTPAEERPAPQDLDSRASWQQIADLVTVLASR